MLKYPCSQHQRRASSGESQLLNVSQSPALLNPIAESRELTFRARNWGKNGNSSWATNKLTEISSSYKIYAWVKNSYATGSNSQSFAAYIHKTETNASKNNAGHVLHYMKGLNIFNFYLPQHIASTAVMLGLVPEYLTEPQ